MNVPDPVVLYGAVYAWVMTNGIAILAIIIGAIIVRMVGRMFLERIIRRFVPSSGFPSTEAGRKREETLIRIARGTLTVLVWIVGSLMVLSKAGIDIGPLLATVGVAGVAVGFGTQYFIRDIIAGILVIIEDQYRVGDAVCLDTTCGIVEDISIRMTTLRDTDGTVHHIAHGSTTKASNLSKDFANVNLNVGVSYASDLEQVIRIISEVGEELAADPVWKADIHKAPHFERVDDFGDSAVIIKILGETAPLRQWAVTGELRKRLKIAFDRAGIEIPFPQRVIHQA